MRRGAATLTDAALLDADRNHCLQIVSKDRALSLDEMHVVVGCMLNAIRATDPGRLLPNADRVMAANIIHGGKDAIDFFTRERQRSAWSAKPLVCKCGNDDPTCPLEPAHSLFKRIAEAGTIPPPNCVWCSAVFWDVDDEISSVTILYHVPTRMFLIPARDHPIKCRIVCCTLDANFMCSKCKNPNARYCSSKHQHEDWHLHKLTCNGPK